MSDQETSLIPSTLVTSGVRDDRQIALAQAFGEALASIDLSKLSMVDPLTVDARLLPFMAREFGAQEFLDPNLPEHVLRRILANIWELKSLQGYDAGVKLGLSFLGLNADIQQWYAQTPMAAPNTHLVNFSVEEFIFEDGTDYFDDRLIAAAWRMINATKRWSQSSEIRLGVSVTSPAYAGAFQHTAIRAEAVADVPPAPVLTAQSGYAAVAHTHLRVEVGG